mgnify:CR=1 FL=1
MSYADHAKGKLRTYFRERKGMTPEDIHEKYQILRSDYGNPDDKTVYTDAIQEYTIKNWMAFLPFALKWYLDNPQEGSLETGAFKPLGFKDIPVGEHATNLYRHFPNHPAIKYIYLRTYPEEGNAAAYFDANKNIIQRLAMERPPESWRSQSESMQYWTAPKTGFYTHT